MTSPIKYSRKPDFYEKLDKKNRVILDLIKNSHAGRNKMAILLINERPEQAFEEVLQSQWIQNAAHNYLQFVDFELEALICYSLQEKLIEHLDIETVEWLAEEALQIESTVFSWFENEMEELFLDAAIDWSYPGALPRKCRNLRITLLEKVNEFILYAECDNKQKYYISTRKGSPLLLNIYDNQDFLKCCNYFPFIQ